MVEYVRLGDVCNINMGQSPSSDTYNENGKGIPFYQGKTDFGEYNPTKRVYCTKPLKIARKNDILISVRAPVGSVNIATEDCCIGRGLAALTSNERRLNYKYLYYFCKATEKETSQLGVGSTFKAISRNIIDAIIIPLPPISEQQHIVEVLDAICAIIQKRKQQIALLDDVAKSMFVEMFGDPVENPMGWDIVKLGEIITSPQNGLYKSSKFYVNERDEGVPILRIDAFYDGAVTDFLSLKRLICTDSEIETYQLYENDIVINRVNSLEYLGKCAHIKGMKEVTVFESNMMRFHAVSNIIDTTYLVKLLCSKYVQMQIMNHAKQAVNQASINQKDVADFNILLPPIELQKEFAARIEKIEAQKALMFDGLTRMDTAYKALMQEYFG